MARMAVHFESYFYISFTNLLVSSHLSIEHRPFQQLVKLNTDINCLGRIQDSG